MKNSFRPKTVALVLCAVLSLGVAVVRADDDGKKPRSRHHRTKTTETVKKADSARSVRPAAKRSVASNDGEHYTLPTRDDRNARETPGRVTGGANGPEYRVPTGSHIPRKYDRKGYSTTDDRNSFIYDQNDQRIQSHNNLSEGLRSVPGVSVRGPRGL